MKSKGKVRLLPLCMILLLLVMTGCNQNSVKKNSEQNGKTVIPPLAATGFANYNEKAVDCSPSIKPYKVDPELDNITNRDMFEFSAEAKQLLVETGFVR